MPRVEIERYDARSKARPVVERLLFVEAVEVLAKQLVKLRNQKSQSLQASGQIQGLATQNTMMASNVRMANAMQVIESTECRSAVGHSRLF